MPITIPRKRAISGIDRRQPEALTLGDNAVGLRSEGDRDVFYARARRIGGNWFSSRCEILEGPHDRLSCVGDGFVQRGAFSNDTWKGRHGHRIAIAIRIWLEYDGVCLYDLSHVDRLSCNACADKAGIARNEVFRALIHGSPDPPGLRWAPWKRCEPVHRTLSAQTLSTRPPEPVP